MNTDPHETPNTPKQDRTPDMKHEWINPSGNYEYCWACQEDRLSAEESCPEAAFPTSQTFSAFTNYCKGK